MILMFDHQGKISEANQKLDEMARPLNEADSSKKKLTVDLVCKV